MLLTDKTEVIKYTFEPKSYTENGEELSTIVLSDSIWHLVGQTADTLIFKNAFTGEEEQVKTSSLGDFIINKEDLSATLWQVRQYSSDLDSTFKYMRRAIIMDREQGYENVANYSIWLNNKFNYKLFSPQLAN